jgi:PhoH-like ATPase
MAAFRANGELEVNGGKKYFPNEYCTLIDETNPKKAALTKVDATGTKLIPIIDCREGVWGIKPRNREQHYAFDALLDDRMKLVTLMGKAGTGKTLMAMAAGLKRTVLTANSAGSSSRARQFPWARNSDSCPARSRKNSRRGCSRSTTRWKC